MPDLNVSMWLPSHLLLFLSGESGLWQAAELQWPHGQRIDLLIWNMGIQVLQLPFYVLLEPITAFNLSLVAMGAANGAAGFVLGRRIGGVPGGVVAGAVLLFSPYAWNEFAQGRAEQGLLAWMALTLSALLALRTNPSRAAALQAGALWAVTGICYWFYAYFVLIAVVMLGAVALVRRRWGHLRALVITSATAAVAAGPLALPLLWRASAEGSVYQQTVTPEVRAMTRSMQSDTSLGLEGLLWVAQVPMYLRDVLPITVLALLLASLASGAREKVAYLAPIAVLGLVLAMGRVLQWAPGDPVLLGGMNLTMPFAGLQDMLPGFERLWWPYRWLSFFFVGAAGCAAALITAVPRKAQLAVAATLAACMLGELRMAQAQTSGHLLWDTPTAVQIPDALRDIAEAPQTGVLLLPYQGIFGNRLLWQAYFQQPTSAGLGDIEDHLLSPAYREHIQATPVLRALQELGRRPPQGAPQRSDALRGGRAELGALGFGYAILWLDTHSIGAYRAWLGEPIHQDETMAIWSLSTDVAPPPP
jgi:hypothetical protein